MFRFDPDLPFRSRVIALSVAALLIFKALILVETWYRRQQVCQVVSFPSSHFETVGVFARVSASLVSWLQGRSFVCITWIVSPSTTTKSTWSPMSRAS